MRVLDDDQGEDGSIFLVMELLEGETLDARFEKSPDNLGVSEVVSLIIDVLDVLAAAHRKGIVHRDIKPENLFLTREGEVKLLDFGIARLKTASPTVTGRGDSLGTPAFMSPEQALGRVAEVDAQSDVWAVGATAFLLLSGRFVHESPTSAEMLVRRGSVPAPQLASFAPRVPQAIAAVVDRALAFDKADRWPSAKAMRDALVEARGDARPEGSTSTSRRSARRWPSSRAPRRVTRVRLHRGPAGAGSHVDDRRRGGDDRRSGARTVRRKRVALRIGAAGAAGLVLVVALSSAPRSPPGPAAVGPHGLAASSNRGRNAGAERPRADPLPGGKRRRDAGRAPQSTPHRRRQDPPRPPRRAPMRPRRPRAPPRSTGSMTRSPRGDEGNPDEASCSRPASPRV